MAIKHNIANALGSVTKSLIRVTGRGQASNFPGRVALKCDPEYLSLSVRDKIHGKKVVVVGTNGKTSTTNLIADIIECAGHTVVCNRTGANMAPGISTALIGAKSCEFGIFECDELWLKDVLPSIDADFVVLLNLFRDQLDRCGEIERIENSILQALKNTPNAQLIYNADDPICAEIALKCESMDERAESKHAIAFGIGEALNISTNTITDSSICPVCGNMLKYSYRQYDKLGNYFCEHCDFSKPSLDVSALNCKLLADRCKFDLAGTHETYSIFLQGAYNIYNALACISLMQELGITKKYIDEVFAKFRPSNGRLQKYSFENSTVLLNLAKNPTGFNQNLKIITNSAKSSKKTAVAFFINDKIADGRDVSWLWDVDFEEMAKLEYVRFFSGGTRKHDMQVRLKYAGVASCLCGSVDEILNTDAEDIYIIANYTALPVVKAQLDSHKQSAMQPRLNVKKMARPDFNSEKSLRIAHMYPDLLNLYGDGGNVRILQKRCEWRGITAEVVQVLHGEAIDFSKYDIVFMGGSPDKEQKIASSDFQKIKDGLKTYVEDNGVLLAICGSYQILGSSWLCDFDEVEGLGILPIHTKRPGASADRLTNNIALSTNFSNLPVIGYENHAGRTVFDAEDLKPFGKVISKTGCGNNEEMHSDGVVYKNVIGTYLHGPLLAKNPDVADYIIKQALSKKYGEEIELAELDDIEEVQANSHMAKLLIS